MSAVMKQSPPAGLRPKTRRMKMPTFEKMLLDARANGKVIRESEISEARLADAINDERAVAHHACEKSAPFYFEEVEVIGDGIYHRTYGEAPNLAAALDMISGCCSREWRQGGKSALFQIEKIRDTDGFVIEYRRIGDLHMAK
jgi:hypothetical protein